MNNYPISRTLVLILRPSVSLAILRSCAFFSSLPRAWHRHNRAVHTVNLMLFSTSGILLLVKYKAVSISPAFWRHLYSCPFILSQLTLTTSSFDYYNYLTDVLTLFSSTFSYLESPLRPPCDPSKQPS